MGVKKTLHREIVIGNILTVNTLANLIQINNLNHKSHPNALNSK